MKYKISLSPEDENWANDLINRMQAEDGGIDCPEGYQFVDENGNVINAQKIVLEKKKKDVSLTQEQINTMIYDSCVLFCKHCGCGIPRETCTSLGTCEEHDEYRNAIRIHLMEKKKKEYPKTYGECAKIMNCPIDGPSGWLFNFDANIKDPYYRKIDILMGKFTRLLICRDAYWKIAGEEMGLGRPWEPDYDSGVNKYGIICMNGVVQKSNPSTNWERHLNKVLDFPTAEMRDAFYENFKELIESCKELL
jgi:hypothetical protein